jgi:hypothetical protein
MTEKIDCIAVKREVQKKMLAEFEANRDWFSTYSDYIRWSSEQPSGDQKFDAWWENVKKQSMSTVQ